MTASSSILPGNAQAALDHTDISPSSTNTPINDHTSHAPKRHPMRHGLILFSSFSRCRRHGSTVQDLALHQIPALRVKAQTTGPHGYCPGGDGPRLGSTCNLHHQSRSDQGGSPVRRVARWRGGCLAEQTGAQRVNRSRSSRGNSVASPSDRPAPPSVTKCVRAAAASTLRHCRHRCHSVSHVKPIAGLISASSSTAPCRTHMPTAQDLHLACSLRKLPSYARLRGIASYASARLLRLPA